MREDPHVTELVGDHGAEFVVTQPVHERAFEGDLVRAAVFDRRLHRDHQGVLRDDGRHHIPSEGQTATKVVDDVLDALRLGVSFRRLNFRAAGGIRGFEREPGRKEQDERRDERKSEPT